MDNYLSIYRDMISLRGLTDHTIKSYSTYIRAFLDYLDAFLHKSPEEVSWPELRGFVFYIKQQRSLSDRTVNCCISQLRFFFLYVLHKPWDHYQLPMRRFDTCLPYVPSKEDTWLFISSITDLKVKAMVSLLYSSGLRIGEVCHLKYQDIERQSMRIHVTHGKNRSDRYAVLSHNALTILTDYWFASGRPKNWLFPKQGGADAPIDTFFLLRHIHAHEDSLGWERRITCHTFRHAYATHCYENGIDLLTIKALLGHKSISSTALYVNLAVPAATAATSPFDRMGGGTLA